MQCIKGPAHQHADEEASMSAHLCGMLRCELLLCVIQNNAHFFLSPVCILQCGNSRAWLSPTRLPVTTSP